MIAVIEQARIDRPRGEFTLSKAHQPVQSRYLRQRVGVTSKALAGPARGCRDATRPRPARPHLEPLAATAAAHPQPGNFR